MIMKNYQNQIYFTYFLNCPHLLIYMINYVEKKYKNIMYLT